MSILKRINWTNTLFLTLVPIAGIVGTVFLCVFGLVHWPTWILMVGLIFLTGLSITAGYHRLFSHRSYKAAWPVRLLLLLFGAATFEGSVLEWTTDHRNHHRYTDTAQDPYDIKKGFWWAHMGWLFMLDESKRNYSNVSDLMADPLIRWQHRFYLPIALLMGFGLPMAIAALWGDAWAGLIIAGALRISFVQQGTFCINSVCHVFGKRSYSEEQSASDHWLAALITYGEGYHNFHHQFPLDYRNGVRLYHYDPTKWLIYGLYRMGLARDLKRIAKTRILHYRIRNDNACLTSYLANYRSLLPETKDVMKTMHDSILGLIGKLERLDKTIAELKKNFSRKSVGECVEDYRKRIAIYRVRKKQMHRELKLSMSAWSRMMKSCARSN
ncbi:MAG: fatty acid desaturase [Gammaproteobacteria bacterium]|nr:fatty acid desaturase [Gammaproteobacteria bacterium]